MPGPVHAVKQWRCQEKPEECWSQSWRTQSWEFIPSCPQCAAASCSPPKSARGSCAWALFPRQLRSEPLMRQGLCCGFRFLSLHVLKWLQGILKGTSRNPPQSILDFCFQSRRVCLLLFLFFFFFFLSRIFGAPGPALLLGTQQACIQHHPGQSYSTPSQLECLTAPYRRRWGILSAKFYDKILSPHNVSCVLTM